MEVNLNRMGSSDFIRQNEIFPESKLPTDSVGEIFQRLDMRDLGQCSKVNMAWNKLATNPILTKNAIYQSVAINPKFWNEIFGKDTISEDEAERAYYLLPLNIAEILKTFSIAFPDKRIINSHLLVWIPKKTKGKLLTINNFGALLKEKEEFSENVDGYHYIWKSIRKDEGEKIVDYGWILMAKDLLPGSRNLFYVDQKKLAEALNKDIHTAWRVPKLAEAIICSYAEYFKSGNFLFNKNPLSYTRCIENVREGQTFVGGFEEEGLDIHNFNFYAHLNIGVASVWKL